MSEEITVTIAPDGEVKVSVKGVKGKACKALTKGLEAALGEVGHSQATKEAYESEQTRTILNRYTAGR